MHEGHRERLRAKFLSGTHLEDHEMLELLLFFSIPRRNTNDIAHTLLDRFGSLQGVFNSNINSLKAIDGVGESSAALIKIISDLMHRYWLESIDTKGIMDSDASEEALFEYIKCLYVGTSVEVVYMIGYNEAGKFVDSVKLSTGLHDTTAISIREMLSTCIAKGMASVILVHNHPDNRVIPSTMDIESTYKIWEALKSVGITLSEHYIYGKGNFRRIMNPNHKKGHKKIYLDDLIKKIEHEV